jgi:hypothetical protein
MRAPVVEKFRKAYARSRDFGELEALHISLQVVMPVMSGRSDGIRTLRRTVP